jgi:hypothetical protein
MRLASSRCSARRTNSLLNEITKLRTRADIVATSPIPIFMTFFESSLRVNSRGNLVHRQAARAHYFAGWARGPIQKPSKIRSQRGRGVPIFFAPPSLRAVQILASRSSTKTRVTGSSVNELNQGTAGVNLVL